MPNYQYKQYTELRDTIRDLYFDTTGKKEISPEANTVMRMTISYILENYALNRYRDSGVFNVRPAQVDDPIYEAVVVQSEGK